MLVDRVREVLRYAPDSGVFRWAVKTGRKTKVGDIAGCTVTGGYRSICVDKKAYLAHRLAWLYVHGEWPHGEIDHINCNPDDNAINNLRAVDRATNKQNMRTARRESKTGVLGASPFKGKYRAYIKVGGRTVALGTFDTVGDAHAAYVAAKRIHHPGCTL